MKNVLAAVGLLTAAVLTACGGSFGHSDSYNKGFNFADGNSLVQTQAGLMGSTTVCGSWATNQAQGLNQQEWIQGCVDALAKKKSG
ncbi:hypothetical protein AWC05_00765 [Mycobacterium florentinum]|uniref:Lipoprotein n=1 Tax=Mycobacterium florentinum TaxID=292462 RepID=A0A1X1TYQ3_MYCFL|nr:hypothetical protein [Mycobacterium florentinum]MCV7409229.1 hypothetical protein [Mycobacterium florentinum]ORV49687.1 hypothetical protein AWC05_00765 [Mycobacterium florentinum]BBX78646.1 hypothetical protein MFLOJ_24330 [Mycobacterium florentinum]